MKIAVKYNIIHALRALAESISLAEKSGVNSEVFVEVLANTLFGGVVYQGYGNLIAKKDYFPAGFTADLGLKTWDSPRTRQASGGLTTLSAYLAQHFEAALAREDLAGSDGRQLPRSSETDKSN